MFSIILGIVTGQNAHVIAWLYIFEEFIQIVFHNCIQFSSVTHSCPTLCDQASLPITNSQSLFKLMFIESVMPSNHFIFYRPLLLLPSIFPSRFFSNESVLCIRWPKYWSDNFNISPSNGYSWLISFRMDWLDLFAVQGTLKSLLQHQTSKASILQCSAFFFIIQHSFHTWLLEKP